MAKKMGTMREKLVDTLELPAEITLNVPKITILAKKEITVENHKGVVKFSPTELVVNTSLGILTIKGNNLEISFVGGTTITLRGDFKGVVYDNNEEI